ncbi:1-acyl-sn-glycerol-3-phosphate acyltransferase [Falsigemmobacter faecalis]|uniref:Glycerol-3-phosphate acyltransferase n=1 Tax=Falsigemmobacter faecalis TaxID=2488730 RepID=A0A3P3DNP4_9RHOB|nr:1-acyl-sn-glycerol-3-phosphate acyltransferase [Falsigemmobacter faecalis]RRH74258.1 glycerol-3-phosphate acyltransferase [Falsigemmobacter faecalis]
MGTVELPVWALVLILGFASVTFASHFLFPSVRWFVRRRMERLVSRLNLRLKRPIEPFKLLERHDLIQQLSYDPQVLSAVLQHARDTGLPRNVAFERARRYAREIVPAFSARTYFNVAGRIAKWLSLLMYRVDVSARDESALQHIPQDSTVIFVMNHRSNMDYVLLTWVASSQMTLSYAVGEWARVWPLSGLIRAMGAYFIRRKSLNPLYRKVLERYVQTATQEGVAQAIFPEGRLSLDGRTAPARLGLLSYILGAAKAGGRPVVFVPVGLNYDRVLEDRLLVRAGETGERRFRAGLGGIMIYVARMFWRRLWGKWDGFGQAAVRYGEPLPLEGLLRDEPDLTPEDLGRVLMARVGDALPVTPVPLVAAALTGGGMTRAALPARMAELRARLEARGTRLVLPDAAPEVILEEGLTRLLQRRILEERPEGFLAVKAGLLDYYAAPVWQILGEPR